VPKSTGANDHFGPLAHAWLEQRTHNPFLMDVFVGKRSQKALKNQLIERIFVKMANRAKKLHCQDIARISVDGFGASRCLSDEPAHGGVPRNPRRAMQGACASTW
jgi:hypothetical protein